MGKRSKFERIERDNYPTPLKAARPVFPYLVAPMSARGYKAKFIEPFAGDGRLIQHLEGDGLKCVYASDIEPRAPGILQRDALAGGDWPECDLVISNPPWNRDILHKAIEVFCNTVADTWFLFDADWAHTLQASPYGHLCRRIVSVGRVKWIEGSKSQGKDNAAWYLFSTHGRGTRFHFR